MTNLVLYFVIAAFITILAARYALPIFFKVVAIPGQIVQIVNGVLVAIIFVLSFVGLYYVFNDSVPAPPQPVADLTPIKKEKNQNKIKESEEKDQDIIVIKELPELSVEQKSQEQSTDSVNTSFLEPKDNILSDTVQSGERPAPPKVEQDNLSVKPLSDIEPIVDGLTFGSQAILKNCWNENELKGNPKDDKAIVKLKNPDKIPPQRRFPIFKERPLFTELKNSIRRIEPKNNKKVIALTFDLCERSNEIAGYDAEIVNYLSEHRIKATFFASGKWLRSHSEKAMQLMANPLFEIGNHTWTHDNLRILESKKVEEQILWTQAQYELLWEELRQKKCVQQLDASEMAKIPVNLMSFRFPYGTCNSTSLQVLAKYGLPAIQWDVVTADPSSYQTAKGIAQIVLKKTKPGSIIICHANGKGHGTADALPMFIPKLKEIGFTFVTVSELLYQGEIVSVSECYEQKPGDNTHYDKNR